MEGKPSYVRYCETTYNSHSYTRIIGTSSDPTNRLWLVFVLKLRWKIRLLVDTFFWCLNFGMKVVSLLVYCLLLLWQKPRSYQFSRPYTVRESIGITTIINLILSLIFKKNPLNLKLITICNYWTSAPTKSCLNVWMIPENKNIVDLHFTHFSI